MKVRKRAGETPTVPGRAFGPRSALGARASRPILISIVYGGPLRLCAGLALLALCAVVEARAQAPQPSGLLERVTTLERSEHLGYGGAIRIKLGPKGSVQVASWRERKVTLEARVELHAPTEKELDTLATIVGVAAIPTAVGVDFITTGPHDKQTLKAFKGFPDALKRMPWRVDYVVWVPEYLGVDVDVYDGEILVQGVSGTMNLVNARGPITLRNVRGSVNAIAADGDVTVEIADRSWRDGNLSVTVKRGDIYVSVPDNFSAAVEAAAPGGITIVGDRTEQVGTRLRSPLGRGGSELALSTASGKMVVTIGTPPPAEAHPDPAPEAEPGQEPER